MKPDSYPTPYRITQAGSAARVCLLSGQQGQVLAAFSKAVYLQPDAGELFWLSAPDAPPHRRSARITPGLPGLSPGAHYRVEDRSLMIDQEVLIDLQGSLPWYEPRRDPALALPLLFPRVQEFFSSLDLSAARGFGLFIPRLLSLSKGGPVDRHTDSNDPVLVHAAPLVMDLAQACLENNRSAFSEGAQRLVGLGPGLTPSGDDFLGGMAFAIHMLHFNYPGLDLPGLASQVEELRPLTHPISFALLSDLVRGHAVAPLHQITNDLLGGQSFSYIRPYVYQLASLGHSTGWDLLAGLLAGLLSTSYCHYFILSLKEPQTIVL
jgi:Protein of unknown function (DUF2877)